VCEALLAQAVEAWIRSERLKQELLMYNLGVRGYWFPKDFLRCRICL